MNHVFKGGQTMYANGRIASGSSTLSTRPCLFQHEIGHAAEAPSDGGHVGNFKGNGEL